MHWLAIGSGGGRWPVVGRRKSRLGGTFCPAFPCHPPPPTAELNHVLEFLYPDSYATLNFRPRFDCTRVSITTKVPSRTHRRQLTV